MMKQIMIRPDLRTAGGELCEVVCGDRFVGQISLVYREGERLAGLVQLDREKLERCDRDVVLDAVNQYVESLIEVLNVTDWM